MQTIYLTITDHLLLFIELTLALIITLAGLYFLKVRQPSALASPIAPTAKPTTPKPTPITITSQDIKAIAGDDIIATQLDLARAYIEIGRKKLAKKILDHVTQHGNSSQQQAAQHLLASL